MFEDSTHDVRADLALLDGLDRLPVPEVSPDFDARIRAALHRPERWWQTLWPSLRPAVAAAACSMAVMLLLVRWSSQIPLAHPIAPQTADTHATNIDLALDRPDLSAAALLHPLPARASSEDGPETAPVKKPAPPALRPHSERRSQSLFRPVA